MPLTLRRVTPRVEDAWLREVLPTGNEGHSQQAIVGHNTGLGSGKNRVPLRYDLTAHVGKTVSAATLTLQNTGGANGRIDGIYYASRLTQTAWGEFTATWNTYDGSTAWTAAGGDYTATGQATVTIAAGTDDLVFTGAALVALVQDALDNRGGVLELLIRQKESIAGDYVVVYLSEDPTPANRPTLALTFANVPAAEGPYITALERIAIMLSTFTSVQERLGVDGEADPPAAALEHIYYPTFEDSQVRESLPCLVLTVGDKWALEEISAGALNDLWPAAGGSSVQLYLADAARYDTLQGSYQDFGNWIGLVMADIKAVAGSGAELADTNEGYPSIVGVRQALAIAACSKEEELSADADDALAGLWLMAAFYLDWN